MNKLSILVVILVAVFVSITQVRAEESAKVTEFNPNNPAAKRVFLNFVFEGESYGLERSLMQYMKIRANETGKLIVLPWGEDLQQLNQAADYIRDSGRYKSNQIPPKGNYSAPVEQYQVTVTSWTEESYVGGSVSIPFSVNGSDYTAPLTVGGSKTGFIKMEVIPYNIETGEPSVAGYYVDGKVTNWRGVAIYVPVINLAVGFDRENFEKTLFGKVSKVAVEAFIKKLLATQ